MASNIIRRESPLWPVAAAGAAHNSGDLVYEAGRVGLCIETNASGAANSLLTHGIVYLPVPGSLSVGQKLYSGATSHTNGDVLQLIGTLTAPTTSAPANFRSAATTSTLTTTSTNVFVGTMRTASAADGASTMAQVELAAGPIKSATN